MKTILLLRHGKSDWDADFDHDRARPLARRGRKDADRMGAFLAITGHRPDRAVSSPAVRARRTAERVLDAAGFDTPLTLDDRLYFRGPEALLHVAQEQPDDADVLLLAGHEPTWAEAVALLIGGGDVRYVTAALARIDVDVDAWGDVDADTGELIWFAPPRLLKALGIKGPR